jgi:two-component system, sensor histidine kinase
MNAQKHKTILLVEDQNSTAMIITQQLQTAGYDVIVVKTGEKAVAVATGGTPIDLILMDILLGQGIEGTEAATQILLKRNVPIVFLSSHTERETVEKVRGITRYGYVIKDSGNFILESSIEMAFELFEANEKVREREAHILLQSGMINSLLDSIPDIIFFKDLNGVYLGCNPSFAEFAGRSKDEITGKTDRDLFGETIAASFTEQDRHMLEQLKPRHNEEWITYPDGRKILVDTIKTPYWGSDGTLIGTLGISRDITSRKKMEEAYNDVGRHRKQLLEIARNIIPAQSQQDLADIIAARMKELISYDTLSIYLLDDDAKQLKPIIIEGPRWVSPVLGEWIIPAGTGVIGAIMQGGEGELVNDAHNDPRTVYPKGAAIQMEQLIVQPLRSVKKTWGALVVNRMSDRHFTPDEFELTQYLSSFASLFLEKILMIDELKATTMRLSNLIQNMGAGILVEDETRHIILVNSIFCSMFNIPALPEHLEGTDCSQSAEQSKHIFSDPDVFVQRIDDLLLHRSFCGNEELNLVDGRTFERDYIPIFVDDVYRGHLWLYRDITERKNSEIKIAQLAKFPEESPSPILRINNDHSIQYFNSAGKIFLTELGVSDQDAAPESLSVIVDLALQRDITLQYEIPAVSGNPIYTCHFVPVIQSGYVNVYALDITARKKAEEELLKAKGAAEESARAKQDFLAKMSHELRTPMNGILGLTNLLMLTQLSHEQDELLYGIKQSGNNLLAIINDVLDFAKIEAGKVNIDQKAFSLDKIIEIIDRTMKPLADQKHIGFVSSIDPDIPSILTGDPIRVNQILLNLVANAIKFTHEGGVLIACLLKTSASDRCTVEFSIRDSGIGISADQIHGIFDRFTQASKDISVRYGGTGLGLTIVKELVELQHGTVSVESMEGGGSTFVVTLPFGIGSRRAAKAPVSTAVEFDKFEGAKILLVEDNEMNQFVVRNTLQLWGITVEIAGNGEEAIRLLHESMYDVVLMDIQMSGIDGFETTTRIRTTFEEPQRSIPILAMTASVLYDAEGRALAGGMNGYIAKPFELADLHQKLSVYLTVKQKGTATAPLVHSDGQTTPFKRINIAFLESIAESNVAFINDMLTIFEQNTPIYIENIRAAIANRDFDAIMSNAHKMKPTGAYIGVDNFKELTAELEAGAEHRCTADELEGFLAAIELMYSDITDDIALWRRTAAGRINPVPGEEL